MLTFVTVTEGPRRVRIINIKKAKYNYERSRDNAGAYAPDDEMQQED